MIFKDKFLYFLSKILSKKLRNRKQNNIMKYTHNSKIKQTKATMKKYSLQGQMNHRKARENNKK